MSFKKFCWKHHSEPAFSQSSNTISCISCKFQMDPLHSMSMSGVFHGRLWLLSIDLLVSSGDKSNAIDAVTKRATLFQQIKVWKLMRDKIVSKQKKQSIFFRSMVPCYDDYLLGTLVFFEAANLVFHDTHFCQIWQIFKWISTLCHCMC